MGRPSKIHRLVISRYAEAPAPKPGQSFQPAQPHGRDTEHHLIPRSRGGQTKPGNLMVVPERMHQSWHHIFRNMTPEEAIVYIASHWAPAGYIKHLRLSDGRNEISLSQKDLLRLRTSDPDRVNIPGFGDAKRHAWVQPVYRRRSKRRRLA